MMKSSKFEGPIFIVGMPRSGTKLLRDLLNNHSQIAITPNESQFIPHFHYIINRYGNLSDFNKFESFYSDFSKTTFFQRLIQKNKSVKKEVWYKEVENWSYAGVIEAFYKCYARLENKTIWGDKTPAYILHLPLLKSLFPEAKFIHIIRDVRDYCISINNAWNKNIYRAAQRWVDSIRKCRRDSNSLNNFNYLEVKYETLLSSPETVLRKVCEFLSISFEGEMIRLNKYTENLGDAKDHIGILKNNYGKWERKLSNKKVVKIERICGHLLSDLGYDISYTGGEHRLGKIKMSVYKFLDSLNIFMTEIKRNGFKKEVSYAIKYNKHKKYL